MPSARMRGERQRLGVAPVDPAVRAERLAAPLELLGEPRIRREVRPASASSASLQLGQAFRRDRGLEPAPRGARAAAAACADGPRGVRERRRCTSVELGRTPPGASPRPRPAVTTPCSRPAVAPTARARSGASRIDLVHQRLGEERLVALVVPPAAVADQVDQEVLAEAVAVGLRQPRDREAGLGVVGIDVHDRDLEALGQVAGVERRARIRPGRW